MKNMKSGQRVFLQLLILLVFFGLILYVMHFTGLLPSWVTIEYAFIIDGAVSFFSLILWNSDSKKEG